MPDSRAPLRLLGGLELRTRSVFDILDTGFRVYRRHFVYLVALAAIPNMLAAPFFLALGRYWSPAPWTVGDSLFVITVRQIVGGMVALWVNGAQLVLTLILGAAGMYSIVVKGRPSVRASVRMVLSRWPAVVVATVGHATALTILACVNCWIPLFVAVYGSLFALFAQIMVFEHLNLLASLERSAQLASHYFLRVLVVLLITYGIFGEVVESTITLPILLGNYLRHGLMGGESQVFFGLLGAGTGLAQSLAWPLLTATLCLLYYDILMRREGLDLRLRCDKDHGSPLGAPAVVTETV